MLNEKTSFRRGHLCILEIFGVTAFQLHFDLQPQLVSVKYLSVLMIIYPFGKLITWNNRYKLRLDMHYDYMCPIKPICS